LDYKIKGYAYNFFNPTSEISDIIFQDDEFNHNYRYMHFIRLVNNYTSQPELPTSEIHTKILREITEILDKLDLSKNDIEKSDMLSVQINSNVDRELLTSVNIEYNTSRKNVDKFNIIVTKYDSILKLPMNNLTQQQPLHLSQQKTSHTISSIAMINLLQEIDAVLSLRTYYSLHNTINKSVKERDLFYLITKNDKTMILTSVDVSQMTIYGVDMDILPTKNQVTNFGSSFISDVLLFMQFNVPPDNQIDKLLLNEQLVSIIPIIKKHFKSYYEYNIAQEHANFYKNFLSYKKP
jgi:hypothetical protein